VEEKQNLNRIKNRVRDSITAQQVVQSVAKLVQTRMYSCVAAVVSRCLQAIFDEPYEFVMRFVEKRGRTEVELAFLRNGNEVDPMSASGGGVVDVSAFALRLAALVLAGSKVAKVLVLDEPFKFVSQEYRERLAELLVKLAEELHIQIVLVTHIEEFRIGTVVEISS